MSHCIEYEEGKIAGLPPHHLTLILKNMALLHARYWKNSSGAMEKIFPIENSTVYLFDSMVAKSWTETARNILVQSWQVMNEYQTILHGDARIGNMMFPSESGKGRFVFIDWQAVRKGKAVYDLAYFMLLSLTSDYRQRVEQESISAYYNYLAENGVKDYTKEELDDDYRHACLCVLVLLSLPFLSGEASAEGEGTKVFAWGMNIWRERLQIKFTEFDYTWMANRYAITEQQGKDAVAEMLGIIKTRLKQMRQEPTSN